MTVSASHPTETLTPLDEYTGPIDATGAGAQIVTIDPAADGRGVPTVQSFALDAEPGQQVTVRLDAGSTTLRLYDGTTLVATADGAAGLTATATSTSQWRLEVDHGGLPLNTKLHLLANWGATTVGTLAFGGHMSDQLAQSDQPDPATPTTFKRDYALDLSAAAPGPVQVTLGSAAFRPKIEIVDLATGAVLTTANGATTGAISAQFTPVAGGRYAARVTSADSSQTGAFTLAVAAGSATAPAPAAITLTTPALQAVIAGKSSLSRTDIIQIFRIMNQDAANGQLVPAEVADLATLAANKSQLGLSQADAFSFISAATIITGKPTVTALEVGVGLFYAGGFEPNPTFTAFGDLARGDVTSSSVTYKYVGVGGPLYGSGGKPGLGDVNQGTIADSYFLGALDALVAAAATGGAKSPAQATLNQFVINNGDGTYTFRFYKNSTPYFITVDTKLATTTNAAGGAALQLAEPATSGGPLWAPLAEKAYAAFKELTGAAQGYTAIGNGGSGAVLAELTGTDPAQLQGDAFQAAGSAVFQAALTQGQAVYLTASGGLPALVPGGHGYALTGLYVDAAGVQHAVVQNPASGASGSLDLTFAQFKAAFAASFTQAAATTSARVVAAAETQATVASFGVLPPASGGMAFDAAYYLAHNPDVAAVVKSGALTALQHWQLVGWREGRNPNAAFNTSYYLAHNPDVAAAGINPLDHFNAYGAAEQRDPAPFFDTRYYLAANPDVGAAVNARVITAYNHFVNFGAMEGRTPSLTVAEQFNGAAYFAANPDVAAALGNAGTGGALAHYVLFGAAEGRSGGLGFSLAAIGRAATGRVADGAVSGATVFADLHGDGTLHADDPAATSAADGSFSLNLAPGSGPLVATGGTDQATGKPLGTTLSGPIGTAYISPVSTLIQQRIAAGGDLVSAEAAMVGALALPAGIDPLRFDALTAVATGSNAGAGAQVAVADVRIATAAALLDSLMVGAGGVALGDANTAAFRGLADALASSTARGTDLLANPAFLTDAIADASQSLPAAAQSGAPLITSVGGAAASLIGAFEAKIDQLAAGAPDAAHQVIDATAVEVVAFTAGTQLAAVLRAGSTAAPVVAAYSGAALDAAVAAALPSIAPPTAVGAGASSLTAAQVARQATQGFLSFDPMAGGLTASAALAALTSGTGTPTLTAFPVV